MGQAPGTSPAGRTGGAAMAVAVWTVSAAALAGAAPAPAPLGTEPSLAERQLDQILEEAPGSTPAAPHWLVRAEDLAPHFDTPALRPIKKDFDQGRYRRARQQLLAQGDAPPVRFLAALAAYNQGDLTTAAAELSALAAAYPALADQCELYAGKASERLGKRSDALAHYARVRDGSSAFADARFGMG